jgi:hypothetical protein
MQRILVLFFFLLILSACEKFTEVRRFEGPCTIELVSGLQISTAFSIEILQSTGTITYRDEKNLLWSLKADEYVSYSCGK